jgi:hypothetical protein
MVTMKYTEYLLSYDFVTNFQCVCDRRIGQKYTNNEYVLNISNHNALHSKSSFPTDVQNTVLLTPNFLNFLFRPYLHNLVFLYSDIVRQLI